VSFLYFLFGWLQEKKADGRRIKCAASVPRFIDFLMTITIRRGGAAVAFYDARPSGFFPKATNNIVV
jgi:hypothetical protein